MREYLCGDFLSFDDGISLLITSLVHIVFRTLVHIWRSINLMPEMLRI